LYNQVAKEISEYTHEPVDIVKQKHKLGPAGERNFAIFKNQEAISDDAVEDELMAFRNRFGVADRKDVRLRYAVEEYDECDGEEHRHQYRVDDIEKGLSEHANGSRAGVPDGYAEENISC